MIRSKADLQLYLREDLKAHGQTRWSLLKRARYPVLAFQRHLRRVEYDCNTKTGKLWKPYLLWRQMRLRDHAIRFGFTIPINVFGPGLSIAHWGTIVIDTKARVGANCRIHPGTAVGHKNGQSPTIGDNAYIGPGSKVFGGITLGNRVQIGANAVVNKSFGDDVVLVGIPAKPTAGG